MVNLLTWLLGVIGVVYLATQSLIFAPVRILLWNMRYTRFFAHGLYCMACTGFWVGVLSTFTPFAPDFARGHFWLFDGTYAGMVALGTGYLVSAFFGGNPVFKAETGGEHG